MIVAVDNQSNLKGKIYEKLKMFYISKDRFIFSNNLNITISPKLKESLK